MPTLTSLGHVSVEKKKEDKSHTKSKKREEQQQHEQGERKENEELLDQNKNGTHSKHKHKRKKSESVKGGEPSPKRSKKDEDKENKKNWGSHSDNDDDDSSEEEEEEEEANHPPNALENFKISDVLRNKLKSKGINSLFPIQAMTYDSILQGHDLVGRARTGQGKTLAFVLPIIESLTNGRNARDKSSRGYGRRPSVIVLVPTRELAKQVHLDFDVYGRVLELASCCVYGGSAYGPQEQALRKGVDIVIGTPGRIKDLIEKGILNLKSLKFRVLDEADEMLNMGFVEDVEIILGKVENASLVQTLLFSATMPDWVKKISSRFLKPEKKTADLVGDDKMKASKSVKHIAIPCFYTARPTVIPDVIQCYSSGGRVIVFTETKNDASELAQLLPGGARALHGDIQQSQRETILAGFRSGKFLVLVATDVAARGLDINDVQLIIQCEPPRDVEAYIHRSGRTGRAGNTGISVMLYGKKKQYLLAQIERQAGFNFDYVSAPQPADIAKATGNSVAESVLTVDDSVLPIFRKPAELLMESGNLAPIDIIAKALAKIAGYTEVKRRSLMNSEEDFVTLILKVGKIMYTPSYAFNVLRRFLPEENISSVKRLSLTADSMGAVFDVPKDEVDAFLAGNENVAQVSIEILESLPDLQGKKDQSWGGHQSSGGGGRRGGGGYNSRGGGRGRGRGRGRGWGRGF